MTERFVIALAQLNPVAGAVSHNMTKLFEAWKEAAGKGVGIVVASELFITGYPPEDFAHNPDLQKAARDAIEALARKTASGPALIVGSPWKADGVLHNAALLLDGGVISSIVLKHDLPNYGPFDEKRVYASGPVPDPVDLRGKRLGIMICEDMWSPGAAAHLKQAGAQVLIVINGSPFEHGKQNYRLALARGRVQETGLPLVYVNQTGGQDELVFEGSSFVMDSSGKVCAQARAWEEDLLFTSWHTGQEKLSPEGGPRTALPEGEAAVYHALVTGLRDYVVKNGFDQVLLGLSGGIDSALTAAIAADAIGPGKVRAVILPSAITPAESVEDALAVARNLGCRVDTISIDEPVQAFEHALAHAFAGCAPDVTEENIQARCRGVLLMALANKSRSMVIATGNKSEMATGYATLYGDMCGGFAPLKDVYKTMIYRLAIWRNGHKPAWSLGPSGRVIPENVLKKPPSAELRPGQTDQETLPPYDVLDGILKCLIEEELPIADILARGYDAETVQKVRKMLYQSEFKRRQAPPGTRISPRHLTRDRRYPITNRFAG